METVIPPWRAQAPRPIALHLSLAAMLWGGGVAAAGLLRNAPGLWHPDTAKRADALKDAIADLPEAEIHAALHVEAGQRFQEFLAGMDAYRRHPYRRNLSEPKAFWESGSTRLLDYGKPAIKTARPVVLIPSMVNRAYILDLAPRRSMVRALANSGLHPYLVDWDQPGPGEVDFDLSDYMTARVGPMLQAVTARHGRPPILIGYCMGGLLAAAAAALWPDQVRGLALLATPWDFHAGQQSLATAAGLYAQAPVDALSAGQTVEIDVLQSFFALLQPVAVAEKFRSFAGLDPASPAALRFVQIEDWVNDGVSLASGVARDCFSGWYRDNRPALGSWTIADKAVVPGRIKRPAIAFIPSQDRIVPQASAQALAAALPDCVIHHVAGGHVSMVVGRQAKSRLWQPLIAWIKNSPT